MFGYADEIVFPTVAAKHVNLKVDENGIVIY